MIDVIPPKHRTFTLIPIGVLGLAMACAPNGDDSASNSAPLKSVAADLERADLSLPGVNSIALTDSDRAVAVAGRLGHSDDSVLDAFGAISDATFVSEKTDALGITHRRYSQTIDGLPLIGGDIRIARDAVGEIIFASGVSSRDSDRAIAAIEVDSARDTAFASLVGADEIEGGQLVYVADSSLPPTLAWQFRVRGLDEVNSLIVDDYVFVDAVTGEIATRHPQFHTAKFRDTRDAQNQQDFGVTVRSEGDPPTGDLDTDRAHDAAGDTYDCLSDLLGRDSFDNAGAQLTSVVHFGVNFRNAGWSSGNQVMVYGDGFAEADVGTHEFGHALTNYTANLIYQNESGAINEGSSDVLMAICDIHKAGAIDSTTWQVGEDIPIGPLRYMDNPVLDGISRDHYENRYLGAQDNGGVHLNSGIYNLFYVLMVEGGEHPRVRGQQVVAAGIDASQQIHLRALTQYMNQTTNFSAARMALEQAATDIFGAGSDEHISVQEAWFAVGVGGAPDARPVCGNGAIERDEVCDDGNAVDGDGCDSTCAAEVCGDSIVNNNGTETCDDGNTVDGDGCDSTCLIEDEGGCGCSSTPSTPTGALWLMLIAGAAFLTRRRRKQR